MQIHSCAWIARIWKILASLLSPTAFALGTVNFADYERAHVGVRWTNIWQVITYLNSEIISRFTTSIFISHE